MNPLGEDGLESNFQLPTPEDTSARSTKSIDSCLAFDSSTYDSEFTNNAFDLYTLGPCPPPLSPATWCDGTPDAASSRGPRTSQNINSKTNTPPHKASDSSASHNSPVCECQKEAINTLEETAIWKESDDYLLVESALATYKSSLAKCETILVCNRCPSPSSITVLVLMIFDKLITSFCSIHACGQSYVNNSEGLVNHHSSQIRPKSMISTSTSGCLTNQWDKTLALADYQIESSNEWSRVVDILVTIQLTKLDKLLSKVRERVTAAKEEVQVQITQQQEDRMRMLKACFEQGTKYSSC